MSDENEKFEKKEKKKRKGHWKELVLEFFRENGKSNVKDLLKFLEEREGGVPRTSIASVLTALSEDGKDQQLLKHEESYELLIGDPMTRYYVFVRFGYLAGREFLERAEGFQSYQHRISEDIKAHLQNKRDMAMDHIEILLGFEYDMLIVLRAKGTGPVGEFVTGFLQAIPGVERTTTPTAWKISSKSEKTS